MHPFRNVRALLPLLVLALTAASVVAQKPRSQGSDGPSRPVLETKSYEFNDLLKTTNETTKTTGRSVFNGLTTRGEAVSLHITDVEPDRAPHPPHQHPNEEIIIVREGTIEMEIGGKVGEFGHGRTSLAGPGSVIFVASNDVHGWHNVGTATAKVYIIAIGNRP